MRSPLRSGRAGLRGLRGVVADFIGTPGRLGNRPLPGAGATRKAKRLRAGVTGSLVLSELSWGYSTVGAGALQTRRRERAPTLTAKSTGSADAFVDPFDGRAADAGVNAVSGVVVGQSGVKASDGDYRLPRVPASGTITGRYLPVLGEADFTAHFDIEPARKPNLYRTTRNCSRTTNESSFNSKSVPNSVRMASEVQKRT